MDAAFLSDPSAQPPHAVLEQAAHWFAILGSGEATPQHRQDWSAWLAASPAHQQAWQRVEGISRQFEPIRRSPERDTAIAAYGQASGKSMRRRQALLGLAGLAGAGALGWAVRHQIALPDTALAWLADHRTGTGEVRQLALPDGTLVWINAVSAFNQHFAAHERRLALMQGEILIDTAVDPQGRPFFVDTPHGRLQALGTRFSVRLSDTDTWLTVLGGDVRVRPTATGEITIVGAGQQLRFTRDALGQPTAADPGREAWTHGLLLASNLPLAEVVQELRRYHPGHLGVSPAVADLRVFGGYPLQDPDQALAMLAAVLPIRVQRTFAWWVSIEPCVDTSGLPR